LDIWESPVFVKVPNNFLAVSKFREAISEHAGFGASACECVKNKTENERDVNKRV